MTVKLIAFDLDGTLLDDDKHLPEENLAALRAAYDRGIFLVPATGRILKALPDELLELQLFRYFIFANGALVYDLKEDRALYRARIEPELAVRLCTYMDRLPVLYDCYRGDCGYMTAWMYEKAPDFFETEPHILKLVKSLRRPVPDLKQKILEDGVALEKLQMYFRPEHMDERARQLTLVPQLFPELIASSSLRNNIEINSARAGKGNALRALCGELGLDVSERPSSKATPTPASEQRFAGCSGAGNRHAAGRPGNPALFPSVGHYPQRQELRIIHGRARLLVL